MSVPNDPERSPPGKPPAAARSVRFSDMDRRTFLAGMAAAGAGPRGSARAAAVTTTSGRDHHQPRRRGPPSIGTSTNRKVKLGFIALDGLRVDRHGEGARVLRRARRRRRRSRSRRRGRPPGTTSSPTRSTAATACTRCPCRWRPGIGGDGRRDIFVAMMLNNNGQAITLANNLEAAGYGDLEAAAEALKAARRRRAGHDLPRRHPRPVAAVLAKAVRRRLRRRGHPARAPGPDGAEHGRRQRAGLLRRRAVGRGGRAAGHRLHPPGHPGPLAQPPGEGLPRHARSSRRSGPTS